VTNPRVDKDGQAEVMARFDACKDYQSSIPANATEQQMDSFKVLCAGYMTSKPGELSIPDNVSEQNLDKSTATN
jgi:hypothetical protein